MEDKRKAIYYADQKRTLKKFKQAWEKGSPKLVSSIKENISKTPGYKKYRKTKVLGQAGLGAGAAGLGAGIAGGWKKGLAGAAAGALVGGGVGQFQASKALRIKAKKTAVGTTKALMNRELLKNMKLHKFLANPGTQKVTVQRPWGKERYSG